MFRQIIISGIALLNTLLLTFFGPALSTHAASNHKVNTKKNNLFLKDSTCIISGLIMDEDRIPIPYASVILQRKDSAIVASDISSANGTFTISNIPPGNYQLRIAMMGYADCFRDLANLNSSLDSGKIVLIQKLKKLEEVTVTGKKPFVERKLDRTVVNISGHVRQIGGNANDALKIAPGVRSVNGTISIVGKGSVLVMINEKLIQLSGKDLSEFLNTIPSENIERLEVLTNPPAKYEASGNTGYINIVLKEIKVEGYNGTLSTSLGKATCGFGNLAGNFNISTEKVKMNFSPSYGFSRFTSWSEQKIYFPETLWNEYNRTKNTDESLGLNYTLKYELSKSTAIDFLYNYSRSPNDAQSHGESKFLSMATGNSDSLLQTGALSGSTTHNHILDISSVTHLDTSGMKLMLDFNYFKRTQPSYRDFQTSSLDSKGKLSSVYDTVNSGNYQRIRVYTASADFIVPIKKYSFSAGTKLSFINSFNDSKYSALNKFIDAQKSIFDYRENTQALYLNLSTTGIKWSYQVGLRGEYTQVNGHSISLNKVNNYTVSQLFPTVFVNYKSSEDHVFSLTYGRRISRPGYSWVNPFRFYNSINSFYEGNPYLTPYYSNNFELVYVFKDMLTTSAYFNSSSNKFDQITIQENRFNGLFQGTVNRNFLNEKSVGISESFSYNKLSRLESTNQATLYHNRVTSTNPLTPRELSGTSAYLSTDNNISLNKKGTFKINLAFWYQFPEVSGVDKVKSYYSLDAGTSMKVFKEKLSLAFNFSDLLKTANPAWDSFINGVPQNYYQYYDTRRFRLAIIYKFIHGKDRENSKKKGNDEWNRAY